MSDVQLTAMHVDEYTIIELLDLTMESGPVSPNVVRINGKNVRVEQDSLTIDPGGLGSPTRITLTLLPDDFVIMRGDR